ncbi:MAG TPA: pro-sigmaK processing inhibitor BofA [Clostridia bacterium]|nr:pro-sigmaK processing inhibitor BofA [Clostridia bacterium]
MGIDALLLYGVGIVLLYLLVTVLWVPARYALSVLYHGVLGGLALWAFNYIAGAFDFHLSINPVTALVTGYLGIPGLGLLIAVQRLLAMNLD